MKMHRLVLWPILITAALTVARLLTEFFELSPPTSGGALNPLGISWLAFVFGGYFALRLKQHGSAPRVRRAWLWGLVVFLAVAAAIPWQFGPFFEAEPDDATYQRLRTAVLVLAAIGTTGGLLGFVIWPRLAWTLLCYALPSRLVVFAVTWLAKVMEWDTHYTKFGPPGIERDLPETLVATALAQGGFWVPFTIVCGVAVGAFFGRRRQAKAD